MLTIYFVYTRAIQMYIKKRFYERQGVKFFKGMLPLVGHLLRYKTIMDN